MIGLAVTFGCVVVGGLLTNLDMATGVVVMVLGALAGLLMTWDELS